jgi:hypothetical protein
MARRSKTFSLMADPSDESFCDLDAQEEYVVREAISQIERLEPDMSIPAQLCRVGAVVDLLFGDHRVAEHDRKRQPKYKGYGSTHVSTTSRFCVTTEPIEHQPDIVVMLEQPGAVQVGLGRIFIGAVAPIAILCSLKPPIPPVPTACDPTVPS